ncbi:hypothetical protein NW765_010055 [Fusarium oxysporum]|nr:hypothetical protein NW765_010055 [Fusarium oxysporum]
MARPNLVTLPYDVRIKIFQDYFRVEGGYVFSSESEKLTTADGQLIDFSLMYTCRSIANDTKHLPFTLNNISFSTFFSPEWRAWAGRHHFLSHFLCILKADLIYHLQGTEMPPELESALQERFPHLMPDFKNRLERVYSSRGFFKKDPSGLSGYAFKYWEESHDVGDIIGDWGDERNILLRHDASIQASRELFRMRPHQFNGAPPYRRWQGGHLSKALKYLIDHHSISESIDSVPLICFNFHPGQPLDIESFIQERLEWESQDWERDGSRLSFHLRQCPPTFGRWIDNLMAYYERQNQLEP